MSETTQPTERDPIRSARAQLPPASIILLLLATLLCLLPFLDKAFHIDDPLFIWTAQWISHHPFDPFGFMVNWYGSAEPMAAIMRNPPLSSYGLAAVGAFFGWGERTLHLAFLAPALACVVGTYRLAQQLCRYPLGAALATLVCPAFLLSATTVMCDVTMLAFWVWALALWIRGIEDPDRDRLLLSALLITLCVLTKYNGATIIPLLLAYTIVRRRSLGPWVVYLILPLAMLAFYLWSMRNAYGGESISAAIWLSTSGADFGVHLSKIVVVLAFVGGCAAVTLFYCPMIWPRWVTVTQMIALGVTAVVVATTHRAIVLAGRPAPAGQSVVLVIVGLNVLGLAISDVLRRRDAGAVLLALSVIGTAFFAGVVSWSISGRYLLPLVPAVGVLLMRAIEDHLAPSGRQRRLVVLAPLLPAAALALLVTWADYTLAGSARTAAIDIHAENGGSGTLWFEGHWGFQYYMESLGAKALDGKRPEIRPGEMLVIPQNNSNVYPVNPYWIEDRKLIRFRTLPWLATMNPQMGAGFYSDAVGPLPFVFGPVPPETYELLRITQR